MPGYRIFQRRQKRLPVGRAKLAEIPSRGPLAFLQRRRLWRRLGMTPGDLGLQPRWYERGPLRPRATNWVWVLQRNSSRLRRVKAVAVSREQVEALNRLRPTEDGVSHYKWSSFALRDSASAGHRVVKLDIVHLLVMLDREYASTDLACKVRVVEAYGNRDSAERALADRLMGDRDPVWAVITYPVGEMLF